MAINRNDLLKLDQIKKELDDHIVGFLTLLEKRELEIIFPYLDIVSGYYGPIYQSYNRYFISINYPMTKDHWVCN